MTEHVAARAEQSAQPQLRDLLVPEPIWLEHAREGALARQEQQPLDRIDQAEAAAAEAGTGGQ